MRRVRAVVAFGRGQVRELRAFARAHMVLFAIGVLLAVLGAAGLKALGIAVGWSVAVGLLALIALAASFDAWKAKALEFAGAVVVGIGTLVGFNVVVDAAINELEWYDETSGAAWIVVGLIVGFVVFSAAAWAYLRQRAHWTSRWALAWAAFAATLFIFVTPLVYAALKDDKTEKRVPKQVLAPVDVFVVADGERPPARAAVPALPMRAGYDVRYSVGFARGGAITWTLTTRDEAAALKALSTPGAAADPAPKPREGSDRVLLLAVDGTPPVSDDPTALPDLPARRGEAERWQRVAAAAGLTETKPYALLQARERSARIRAWERIGGRPRVTAQSVQALGSQLVTDAGYRLAITPASARGDFELAKRHRPILLFNSDEPVPRPLSIEALFRHEKIRECPLRGGDCGEPLTDPTKLENGDTRLELDRPRSKELRDVALREQRALETSPDRGKEPLQFAAVPGAPPPGVPPPAQPLPDRPAAVPGEPLSTIYVRPVPREVDGRSLLYLDYWWFLPDNPARAGEGAFCGAALVIPGVSCFNHESDWEGITVVLEREIGDDGSEQTKPVAVHYAEHSSIVRYGWTLLWDRWDASLSRDGRYARSVDPARERPRVYVARGTHAGYPLPCRSSCKQTGGDLEEKPHDGLLPWAGNGSEVCGPQTTCLTALPTRSGGNRPALWNAFRGPWGKATCFLRYCNSTNPPSAPGTQSRYKRPWSCSGEAKAFDARGRVKDYEKRAASCQNG